MTSRAIILVGLPASGKTTYALSAAFSDFEYIESEKFDEIGLIEYIEHLIHHEKNFLIDGCNPSVRDRKKFLDIFARYPQQQKAPRYSVECHYLDTSLTQSKINADRRMSNGGERFNVNKAVEYRRKFELPTKQEGFTAIIRLPFTPTLTSGYTNKALFFSLDGTVRHSTGEYSYPTKASEIRIYPEVNVAFVPYIKQGYRFFGVTNQPGISRKEVTEEHIQDCLIETMARLPIVIDDMYYCPHVVSDQCSCRMPSPFFAFQAREKYKLQLSKSIMVGNGESDRTFSINAGIGTFIDRDSFFYNSKPHVKGVDPIEEAKKIFDADVERVFDKAFGNSKGAC